MSEEQRTIGTLKAAENLLKVAGQQHEEVLAAIADDLRIMLASSTELVDGLGNIHGYQIKTGALHRILGRLAGVNHPVVVPAVAHRATHLGASAPVHPDLIRASAAAQAEGWTRVAVDAKQLSDALAAIGPLGVMASQPSGDRALMQRTLDTINALLADMEGQLSWTRVDDELLPDLQARQRELTAALGVKTCPHLPGAACYCQPEEGLECPHAPGVTTVPAVRPASHEEVVAALQRHGLTVTKTSLEDMENALNGFLADRADGVGVGCHESPCTKGTHGA